jgi:hypothetical protein
LIGCVVVEKKIRSDLLKEADLRLPRPYISFWIPS